MPNVFDAANYPAVEPKSFFAGDRIAWKRSDLHATYNNALFALSYVARLEDGSQSLILNATASGTDYLVEIPSSTTATYTSGTYHWSAYITRISDSERISIQSGQWVAQPNKSTSTADLRSHSKKVLDAIEAVLENRATLDQTSIKIAGKELINTPIPDLLLLLKKYKNDYLNEQGRPRRKIRTRMI